MFYCFPLICKRGSKLYLDRLKKTIRKIYHNIEDLERKTQKKKIITKKRFLCLFFVCFCFAVPKILFKTTTTTIASGEREPTYVCIPSRAIKIAKTRQSFGKKLGKKKGSKAYTHLKGGSVMLHCWH